MRACARTIDLPAAGQVRIRPPIEVSAATTAATVRSTSGSVSVRSPRTQPEPDGEALLVRRERDAAVDVEQRDSAQQLAGVRPHDLLDRGGGRRLVDDDREVAVDLGKAADRRRPFRARAVRAASPSSATSARITRWFVLSSHASTIDGWSSPTIASRRPAIVARAVRPGWNTGSSASAT